MDAVTGIFDAKQILEIVILADLYSSPESCDVTS